MSFDTFELSPLIHKAIRDVGYTQPTEIQAKAIPLLTKLDKDFVGQAQTGTGKTAAFLLPLLERIDPESPDVQALILTPTRELAHQVFEELEKFSKHLNIRSTTVYGGTSYEKQIKAIKKDRAQIIVGTPGRVIDLIRRKVLKLKSCTHLVIDEADEMLNMGFIEDVEVIMSSVSREKSMWMFSATMPGAIVKLINTRFSNPEMVKLQKKEMKNDNIKQYYCLLQRKDFSKALKKILEQQDEGPNIVFCETRNETKNLTEELMAHGISAAGLHGELSQTQRDSAMKKFKQQKVSTLVCTDVASRGIDVSNIEKVFNMGLPRHSDSYVHRIGRTGRAGQKGEAISFIAPVEKRKLRDVESLTGQKMDAYKLPCSSTIKETKVSQELQKMDSLKSAIQEHGEDFKVDQNFANYEEFFSELSKEQALKLLFSYRFNKEFRQVDQTKDIQTPTRMPAKAKKKDKARFRGSGRRKKQA